MADAHRDSPPVLGSGVAHALARIRLRRRRRWAIGGWAIVTATSAVLCWGDLFPARQQTCKKAPALAIRAIPPPAPPAAREVTWVPANRSMRPGDVRCVRDVRSIRCLAAAMSIRTAAAATEEAQAIATHGLVIEVADQVDRSMAGSLRVDARFDSAPMAADRAQAWAPELTQILVRSYWEEFESQDPGRSEFFGFAEVHLPVRAFEAMVARAGHDPTGFSRALRAAP